MTTMYRRDGTAVDVPNEQIEAARASGELFFKRGQEVNVLSPTGERLLIDQAEIGAALGQGFQLEPEQALAERAIEQKYGEFGAPLRAAAGGFTRGLTVGLSDLAVPTEVLQEQEQIEKAYPKLALGGEITGFAAPLILSGGTAAPAAGASLAAKVSARTLPALISRGAAAAGERFAGQGIARQVARYGVEGAIEGAAYGAGQGLHEAALTGGDPDTYAEKILAGAAHGAAFGGLTGAGLGAAAYGVRRGGEKLLAGLDPAKLSDELAVRAIDPSKRAARELQLSGRTLETGQDLKALGIVKPGASMENMLEAANVANENAATAISGMLKKLDDVGARVDAVALKADAQKVIDGFSKSLSRADQVVAKRLQTELRPLLEKAGTPEGVTFAQLHEVRRGLDKQINFAKRGGDPIQEGLLKLRGTLEETLEGQAEQAFKARGMGELFDVYKPAKRAFGSSRWAQKQLTDNLARGQANHFLGLLDRVTGTAGIGLGLATGSVGVGVLGTAAMALGSKLLREKGAGILSTALARAAKTDSKIANSVRQFARETKRQGEVGVGAMKDTARAKDFKERRSTARTFKQRDGESRQDAYRRSVKEVTSFDLPDIQKRLGNLASEMPSTAAALVAKLTTANEYLRSHLPTGAVSLDPLQPNQKPMATYTQIQKFSRIKRAVDNPLSILDDMESGVVSVEAVHAVRAVYPEIYQQMQSAVLLELGKTKNRIPYTKRAVLGAMFGIEANPVQNPQRLAQTQAVFQPKEKPQGGGPRSSGPSKSINQFRTELQSLGSGDFQI
jgi:hypothetical protein